MRSGAWQGVAMLRGCAVLFVAVAALAACGGSSQSGTSATTVPVANAGATVSLKNIAFNPGKVTIQAGQAVVWTFNDGDVPHNVTGPGFASVTESKGTYVHTFNAAGTYKYTCTIHSGMDGSVIVNP